MSEKHLNVKRCPLQSGITPSSQHCKLDTMHDDHIFLCLIGSIGTNAELLCVCACCSRPDLTMRIRLESITSG